MRSGFGRFLGFKGVGGWNYMANSLYVGGHLDVSHKKVLEEMIKNIRTALSHMIREAEWMDQETTQNALRKLDHMRHVAAYPDEILNKTMLEELFKGDIILVWVIITYI